jgi:hypothetical protein
VLNQTLPPDWRDRDVAEAAAGREGAGNG